MANEKHEGKAQDLTRIFDTIEFPDAYRITYLANAIVIPGYDAVKRDFGIIRSEYFLLCCLSHFPELLAQDVARIARQPRNTVSRAVHRMLDEGYIERSPDPDHGRKALLSITRKGRALHEKIAVYLKARQDEVLGGLDQTERELFRGLLRKAALHAATLKE